MSSVQQFPEPQDSADESAETAGREPARLRPVRQLRERGQVRQPKRSAPDAEPPAAPEGTSRPAASVDPVAKRESAAARDRRAEQKAKSAAEPRAAAATDDVKAKVRTAAAKRSAEREEQSADPAARSATKRSPRTRTTPAAAADAATSTAASPRKRTVRAVRAPKAGDPEAIGRSLLPAAAAAAAPVAASAEPETEVPATVDDAIVTPHAEVVLEAEIVEALDLGEPAEIAVAEEAFDHEPTEEPSSGLDDLVALGIVETTEDREQMREFEALIAPTPVLLPEKAPTTRPLTVAPVAPPASARVVLDVTGLTKTFGRTRAVAGLDLQVRAGSFYGIVGPNGAGKTTTLSMITGLLRPDAGSAVVHGIDVWDRPDEAKRVIGVLPDRLRLFDRLTGAQLLYYAGSLHGIDSATVRARADDLVSAFGLDEAINRLVADYSAGMTKKIALACAMIHSPRLLVLDEPFEAVDPVSSANLIEILQKYVAAGGTVVLSSHGMDMIERICDSVAVIVGGEVLASGTLDEVRQGERLEERFVELAGGRKAAEGMEWLHSFSD